MVVRPRSRCRGRGQGAQVLGWPTPTGRRKIAEIDTPGLTSGQKVSPQVSILAIMAVAADDGHPMDQGHAKITDCIRLKTLSSQRGRSRAECPLTASLDHVTRGTRLVVTTLRHDVAPMIAVSGPLAALSAVLCPETAIMDRRTRAAAARVGARRPVQRPSRSESLLGSHLKTQAVTNRELGIALPDGRTRDRPRAVGTKRPVPNATPRTRSSPTVTNDSKTSTWRSPAWHLL